MRSTLAWLAASLLLSAALVGCASAGPSTRAPLPTSMTTPTAAPAQTPVPTPTAAPAPKPEATPAPMAETAPTRAPEPEHSQEPDTPNPVNLEEFVASLSESERSCVAAETFGGDVEFLTMQLEAWGLSILYTEDPVVECLDDESVRILVTAGLDHRPRARRRKTALFSAGLTGKRSPQHLDGAESSADQ